VNRLLQLTDRDREIVLALVQKVRLFSQRQIADHWWNGELANARKRMNRLASDDWVQPGSVQARPIQTLESPLVTWRPGETDPDFGAIAYRCRTPSRRLPSRLCTIWIASERSSQMFGGVRRGELKNPLQATHDLGVAAVWLRLHEVSPIWAAAWRSEDLLAHTRRGEKIPDAFIVDEQQHVLWVIEYSGGYDAERIREFHIDCAERRLGYQLW
jgi:hypothetical protein